MINKLVSKLFLLVAFNLLAVGAWAQQTIYVNHAASGVSDGSSWTDAYTDLQSAINAASAGDEVWVAAGTYHPTENLGSTTDDRDKTFILREGVRVYGGFAGTEPGTFDLDSRDFVANETILSGDFNNNDVATTDGEGAIESITGNTENAHHVVVSYDNSPETVLDGFTITGGNADGSDNVEPLASHPISRGAGGGLYLRGSSTTLTNLIVKHNNGIESNSSAGGIFVGGGKQDGTESSLLSLTNVSVEENMGVNRGAGAVFAGYTNYVLMAKVENSSFARNSAGQGGAISVTSGVNLEIASSTFTDNKASGHAGAIYTLATAGNPSTVNIVDSEFTKNKTDAEGGAIRISTNTTATITNSTFTDNEGAIGGAINSSGGTDANQQSAVTIMGSTFTGNRATGTFGGAVYKNRRSTMSISHSRFVGNSSASSAAAVYFNFATHGPSDISNSLFYNNSSGSNGAAVQFGNSASGTLNGVTIYGNEATGNGAIHTAGGNAHVNLYNSIVYGNTVNGGDITHGSSNATHEVKNSITQTIGTDGEDGVQVGADPQFASIDPEAADFLKLASGSPAIDAGDNDLYDGDINSALDLAGLPRVYNDVVDLGAFERQDEPTAIMPDGNGILYVNQNATGNGLGYHWDNALTDLSEALQAADDQSKGIQQIWVAAGTYHPGENLGTTTDDRDKAFILREGVKVYGGFAGNEPGNFNLDDRDFATNETILSGDFNGDDAVTLDEEAITSIAGNNENAHHVVVSYDNSPETVLDGFTITGGNADGSGEEEAAPGFDIPKASGGGIASLRSSPTLANLVVKHNRAIATISGAGLYLFQGKDNGSGAEGTLSMTQLTVTQNLSVGNGAGLYVVGASSSSPFPSTITESVFSGNNAGVGNSDSAHSGGIHISRTTNVDISKTIFNANKATGGGAAVYTYSINTGTAHHITLNITDSEFTGNEAGNQGGAARISTGTTATIANSIFSNNEAVSGGAIYLAGSSSARGSVSITGSTFIGNAASASGGAIFKSQQANVSSISHSKFIGNTSGGGSGGGALYLNYGNDASSANVIPITQSIFANNTSAERGGAISAGSSAVVALNGTTFYANHATGQGGVIGSAGTASRTFPIYNSILVGNTSEAGSNEMNGTASATFEAKYSITQETGTDGEDGVQVGVDPQFASVEPESPDFLHLTESSPAINAGDNDLYAGDLENDLDLAGNPRVYNFSDGGIIDLGAFEFQGEPMETLTPDANGIVYVKHDATGEGTGSSWEDAATNLSEALISAGMNSAIEQIWVAGGTYHPTENLQNPGSIDGSTDPDERMYRAFILREGVKVYGGFAGTEEATFDLGSRDFSANETILSGDFDGNDAVALGEDGAIESISGNEENAYHVVVSWDNSPETVLDGFTISGGNAGATGGAVTPPGAGFTFNRSQGGGLVAHSSSPTLHNLVVKHNSSINGGTNPGGAGMYINGGREDGSEISFANLDIRENLSRARGGGIFIQRVKATVDNSRFIGNTTLEQMGGGLYIGPGSEIDVTNAVFENNSAPTTTSSRGGGALSSFGTTDEPITLTITDSEFTNNKADQQGGAARISTATTATIENTTFTGNTATTAGALYVINAATTVDVINSTFTNSEASGNGGAIFVSSGTASFTGSTFTDNKAHGGTGAGALYIGGAVTISQSTFTGNETTSTSGAGIYITSSGSADISETEFTGNISSSTGGAIRVNSGGEVDITESTFTDNTATGGGGAIYLSGAVDNLARLSITGSTFTGNEAGDAGGAIFKVRRAVLSISHSKFIRNKAGGGNGGGALYLNYANEGEVAENPIPIEQSLFAYNESALDGGAISTQNSSVIAINGSTFYGNRSTGVGGAIRYQGGADRMLEIYNSIIADNMQGSVPSDVGTTGDGIVTFDIRHSITQVTGEDGQNGVQVGADPGFVSTDENHPEFLRLKDDSPAIDAGDNALYEENPSTLSDLAGNDRLMGVAVDLGAYEGQSKTVPALELRWNGNAIPTDGLSLILGDEGTLTVVTNSNGTANITADALLELSSNTSPTNVSAPEIGSGEITVTLPETDTYASATLTIPVEVGKLPQQIRLYAPQGVDLSEGRSFITEASSSSGLPVTLSIDDESVATLDGLALILHRPGVVRITATQDGDERYAAAEPVTVEFHVVSRDVDVSEVRVHPALSPNGDGINDFLLIEGIDRYPGNRLIIFDHNGNVIEEVINYDNRSRVFTGEGVREGTYFYRLEYRSEGRPKRLQGFFELRR